jgi:hypothetical protein
MRSIILLTAAAINLTLLSACTINPAQLRQEYNASECSRAELEDYTDCQDGHRVVSAPLKGSAPLTDMASAG